VVLFMPSAVCTVPPSLFPLILNPLQKRDPLNLILFKTLLPPISLLALFLNIREKHRLRAFYSFIVRRH